MSPVIYRLITCLVLWLFFCGAAVQADEGAPVVMLAGFESRVTASDITLTHFDINQKELLSMINTAVSTELAGDPRYAFYDNDATIARARMDEAALINDLGQGRLIPSLQANADYLIFGYLTNLSEVKAQTGALGLNGKAKTVHLEISMRVMDAHTGAIVFATTADSRRKSQLVYHAILQRNDTGQKDAVREAVNIAAQNLATQFKQAV